MRRLRMLARARRTARRRRGLEREGWLAWYAGRGLATIPVVPRGKRPLRAGWQRAGREAWVGAPADVNLGVVCGDRSGGLVVLDFDTQDGVLEAMGMRPERVADHTLVVRTARGWHVYAWADDCKTFSPWPGLDVRGEGSLVVAPPSMHSLGMCYEFVRQDVSIARLSEMPIELGAQAEGPPAHSDIDWEQVRSWIRVQSPKLQASWRALEEGARPSGFDRSRADFAVARCLWEGGYPLDDVAAILQSLPGSKARERGADYARRTAARAAAVNRAASARRE